MRAELARTLFADPDIILLDEPTNHLDLDALLFLEKFLRKFKGSLVLVSHDREFLDNVAGKIIEMEMGRITVFNGNYTIYEKEKAAAVERWSRAYREQNEEIERIKRFISRFRARKDMAPRVRSRIKFLEKMEKIDPPPDRGRTVRFTFPEPPRSGRIVLEMNEISKSYNGNDVLKGFDFMLERGDRLALTGPNGTGKSTLSRIISGVEEPDSGSISLGYKVKVGYFAQEQAELLDSEKSLIKELEFISPGTPDHELRSLLGAFLFGGDSIFKKANVLSGGEKCRLSLARLLLRAHNFYVLDEPTNHLDISSKDVLVDALSRFTGTFILVSHDRYVLEKVCNKVLEIVDGKPVLYPGGYNDYMAMKKRRIDEEQESSGNKP